MNFHEISEISVKYIWPEFRILQCRIFYSLIYACCHFWVNPMALMLIEHTNVHHAHREKNVTLTLTKKIFCKPRKN